MRWIIHVWNNGIKVWLECGIDSHGTGCMLLGRCVPVLTLDVLQIAEYCFAHVGGLKVDPMLQFLLVYLAKCGYFSAVLLFKWSLHASCFCAAGCIRSKPPRIRPV